MRGQRTEEISSQPQWTRILRDCCGVHYLNGVSQTGGLANKVIVTVRMKGSALLCYLYGAHANITCSWFPQCSFLLQFPAQNLVKSFWASMSPYVTSAYRDGVSHSVVATVYTRGAGARARIALISVKADSQTSTQKPTIWMWVLHGWSKKFLAPDFNPVLPGCLVKPHLDKYSRISMLSAPYNNLITRFTCSGSSWLQLDGIFISENSTSVFSANYSSSHYMHTIWER